MLLSICFCFASFFKKNIFVSAACIVIYMTQEQEEALSGGVVV